MFIITWHSLFSEALLSLIMSPYSQQQSKNIKLKNSEINILFNSLTYWFLYFVSSYC